MIVVRADRLVARDAGTDLDTLDQADLLELLEDPIDRSPVRHAWPGREPVLDLERRQRAGWPPISSISSRRRPPAVAGPDSRSPAQSIHCAAESRTLLSRSGPILWSRAVAARQQPDAVGRPRVRQSRPAR